MIPAPGLGRRLRGVLQPLVTRAAATPGVDRYRKHFGFPAHLWILLWHVLDGSDSLRQTHARLAAQGFAKLGLAQGISVSQLACSSTSRAPAAVEQLLADLVATARSQADPQWRLLTRIQVVDATFLALSAKRSPWSCYKQHPAGVRLQTGFDLGAAIPASLRLTRSNTHDTTAMRARELTELAGWTVIFDLGYYGHRLLRELRDAEVSFVSRLHPQAHYVVTGHHPVESISTPHGDEVLSDQTITLGSPHNRAGAVVPQVRLVTSCTAAGASMALITDCFDLRAVEVVALYRLRWQIELFFRWLKHQLKLQTPLGTSQEAIWLTVLIAAIVAVLVVLLGAARPRGVSRVAFARALATILPRPSLTNSS